VSDNAESKATDIAINEAVRLREGLVGSLNPNFGPVSGDWSVWTEGRIVIGKTDASTTASKKEIEVQAISLGIDRPVGDGDELMGFVLSIGQDDTDIGTASTNVKSDNYSISNYNVFRPSANIQIESVFGLGQIDFDTTRTDGSDTLSGTRKANQLFLTGVIRPLNRMHLGSWQFSPYSKVSAANTSLKAFSESGGATALTHNKQKLKDTAVAIGLDIHSQITRNTRSIKPFAKIEYNELSSKTTVSMHYNSEDASTYTYTKRFDKKNKHWKLKLGLDLNTESGWNSSASYTREQSFGSSNDSQTSDSFSLNAVLRF
jgi:outer membrane autotransporter protein